VIANRLLPDAVQDPWFANWKQLHAEQCRGSLFARLAALSEGLEPQPGGPEALPIVEAVPEQEDFYDFESRYEIGRTRFQCPAELEQAIAEKAAGIARDAYSLLGCAGVARVDLMMDTESGELYVLEVNPRASRT